jgi:hypothetical protein
MPHHHDHAALRRRPSLALFSRLRCIAAFRYGISFLLQPLDEFGSKPAIAGFVKNDLLPIKILQSAFTPGEAMSISRRYEGDTY